KRKVTRIAGTADASQQKGKWRLGWTFAALAVAFFLFVKVIWGYLSPSEKKEPVASQPIVDAPGAKGAKAAAAAAETLPWAAFVERGSSGIVVWLANGARIAPGERIEGETVVSLRLVGVHWHVVTDAGNSYEIAQYKPNNTPWKKLQSLPVGSS